MTVAEQVIAVFTGVKGYLDDVDLDKIKNFEKDVIEKIKSEKPEIIEAIQSGKLEKIQVLLKEIIEEYKNNNAYLDDLKKELRAINLHKKLLKLWNSSKIKKAQAQRKAGLQSKNAKYNTKLNQIY